MNSPSALGPTGQGRHRHRRQVTREHRGAPQLSLRKTGGSGDGIGHHAGQCALAQFSLQKTTQERLLDGGCGGEQPGQKLGPLLLGAFPCDRADLGERRIDTRHGESRLIGRWWQGAQRGPSDTDLPLGQLARQPGDDDRDLVCVAGRRSAQQGCDAGDLRQP